MREKANERRVFAEGEEEEKGRKKKYKKEKNKSPCVVIICDTNNITPSNNLCYNLTRQLLFHTLFSIMGQSKVLINHKFLYIASETDDNDVEAIAHAKKEYKTHLRHSSTEKGKRSTKQ